MKYFRLLLAVVGMFLMIGSMNPSLSQAQCAMCSLNAENSVKDGNTQGKGLNDGVLFLLAIPYLIAVGIGVLWYTKYRKPQQNKIVPFENNNVNGNI